ncbi:hypothetical protein ACHAWF_016499 [Thalassiosira exigua]
MKLLVATLAAGTAAASSIDADSKVGKHLLSRARRLDGEGNNDMSWASGYSLRFEKCATSSEYFDLAYYGGNGGNNNQNNDNNDNRNGYYGGMYEQRLVHFKLCPRDTCGSGCSGGGDYVIDLNEFVESYVQAKQEAQEAECQSASNDCYCQNANDDQACEAQCWMSAGIYDQCNAMNNNGNNNNNNNGQQQFALEDAAQCQKLEMQQNNNNGQNNENYYNGQNYGNYYNGQNNGQQNVEFFVGPYCSSNGKSILLGVFMDEMCSFSAPEGVYENSHYGQALPYSSKSIVSKDCISCEKQDENANQNNNNNNNNNQNYNYNNNQYQYQGEVTETCQNLYQASGKCESGMDGYGRYRNSMACDFIKSLKGGVKQRIVNAAAEMGHNVTANVLAVIFGITTLAFGAVAYHLHDRVRRRNLGLAHGEGHVPF